MIQSKQRHIRKVTSRRSVDYKGAMAAASALDLQKKLDPGFPQLMLRVSSALNGMRFGQPPGTVS